MLETREHIDLTESAVERGYRSCQSLVRAQFRDQIGMAANLPKDRYRALMALLAHVVRTFDLMDLESHNHLPLDVWIETRDDLSDAFQDQCVSVELAALVDGCRRFEVPRQYLFDMLEGADWWIRTRRVENEDDLLVMAYRLGGAPLTAAVPIFGAIRAGYEVPAIRCGQAILLTQALAGCVDRLKANRNLLPHADFADCKVDLTRLQLRQPSPGLETLVRRHCRLIEGLFREGGELVSYLDFDGRRSLTSLLGYYWRMLVKMKLDPSVILQPEGVLTARERLAIKTRHLMGLESDLPILPHGHGHGGH